MLRATIAVVAVLAVLACGVAGWYGVSWYRAAHSESIALGTERETVLREARQAAINLTTLDAGEVQEGLDRWEEVSAGTLLEEFTSNRETYARTITEAESRSESKVVDAAVVELNPQQGTARVLVGLDVTVTPREGEPTLARQRLLLQMTRTDAGWKASAISPTGP